MVEQSVAQPEHIYVSVAEITSGRNVLESVRDKTYQAPCKDEFLLRCVHKIYQMDPNALMGRDRLQADSAKDAGSSRFSVERSGVALSSYPVESYAHFMGNGDKVAQVLCMIFNYRSDPNEPVLLHVTEQLSGNPGLEEIIHPENSQGDGLKKRHFLITAAGSLQDYMYRHPVI